jgi:hypothetical protein
MIETVVEAALIRHRPRYDVTGLPWTPMLATRPTGRTSSAASSKGLRHTDSLDRHICAEPTGEFLYGIGC